MSIKRGACWLLAVQAVQCLGLASAGSFSLTSSNSTVAIDVTSPRGMFDWIVDGQDQLARQWFWYQMGGRGADRTLDSLRLLSVEQPEAGTLETRYGNRKLQIEIVYSLLGGSPGSGISEIAERITIENLSRNSVNFRFLQFADFDLGGDRGGDIVQLGTDLEGNFNEALQADLGQYYLREIISPGADHARAAWRMAYLPGLRSWCSKPFNWAQGPGPGNAAYAFEWDIRLAPGSSFLITIDKTLTMIPEPSAAALISLCAAAFAIRRRTSRRCS